jgi:DNA-binding transcriptional ArsR family regulator
MARRTALPKVLTLDDPRAIRALAHEARQRLIDELYSGCVLTATEASTLVGLTPSATSYHLRALEKWGIVVRDTGSGDGRERPWRAAARSLHVGRAAHGGASTATSKAYLTTFLEGIRRTVEAWAEASDGRGPADSGQLNRGRLFLRPEEAATLRREAAELIERYEGDRTAVDHPEDAEAHDVVWMLLPTPSSSGAPTAQS